MLRYLAEGFTPEEVYRDVVAERRPAERSGRRAETEHVSWSGTPSPFLPISAAPKDAARRW
ncbi:hypothetical protein ACFSTC_17805 [Nonomuraea ferruginea]